MQFLAGPPPPAPPFPFVPAPPIVSPAPPPAPPPPPAPAPPFDPALPPPPEPPPPMAPPPAPPRLPLPPAPAPPRSEEHTSELQSPCNLVCRLLLEKKQQEQYKITRHSYGHTHHSPCARLRTR